MANALPVKTARLKAPDQETIEELVRIYQEAYKNDKCVQLKYIVPDLMEEMAKIITDRVEKPQCEFIVARNESTNQIVGWLALAFKLEKSKQLSEEHVLLAQYALIPDISVKGRSHGIDSDEIKSLAESVLKDFKGAREKQLLDKHCILSTLVVDPEYQNSGVASALLSKAISLSEVFLFPIWVQAPEACQRLFERHLFEEVGEYQLDLNEYEPKADKKGKAKAVSTLGKYVWKFMVRKEPLDQALQAYKSSKVFAESQADQEVEKSLRGKDKGPARISEEFAADEAEPGPTDLLLGEDFQSASGESVVAESSAEEGPSTPLLTKLNSKGGQKAVSNVMSS